MSMNNKTTGKLNPEIGLALLQPALLAENLAIGKIDPESGAALLHLAGEIGADPLSAHRFEEFYHRLFEQLGFPRSAPELFPNELPGWTEAKTWGFYALLVIAGFPFGIRHFADCGMPREVADGALIDLSVWLTHFRKNRKITGISPRILDWECGLLNGGLYRLGRLQFGICPFHEELYVYRHRQTRQVQALAADGIKFNADGQYDGVDGHFAAQTWISRLTRDARQVSGNPITPQGNAENRVVTLPLELWEEVLTPHDRCIDTHIPEGEPLTTAGCDAAMRQAVDFFPKFFPDQPVKAFRCISWLLDNQYEKILKAESNILRFQRELYLFPVNESGNDSYWRIFGEDGLKNGPAHAPRTNSMQTAMAAFLEHGGVLRSGGGFFLIDDLPFGNQVYRV